MTASSVVSSHRMFSNSAIRLIQKFKWDKQVYRHIVAKSSDLPSNFMKTPENVRPTLKIHTQVANLLILTAQPNIADQNFVFWIGWIHNANFINHSVPASVNCTVANAYQGVPNFKSLCPGQQLGFILNPSFLEGVKRYSWYYRALEWRQA